MKNRADITNIINNGNLGSMDIINILVIWVNTF